MTVIDLDLLDDVLIFSCLSRLLDYLSYLPEHKVVREHIKLIMQ